MARPCRGWRPASKRSTTPRIDVTIRTGHTFSDGKPVTADDVKFSFDYMKEWKAPYFTQHLSRVASVEVLAPDKIRFRLTEPYAPFIMNTLGQMYVLPKHVWEPLVTELGIAEPSAIRQP